MKKFTKKRVLIKSGTKKTRKKYNKISKKRKGGTLAAISIPITTAAMSYAIPYALDYVGLKTDGKSNAKIVNKPMLTAENRMMVEHNVKEKQDMVIQENQKREEKKQQDERRRKKNMLKKAEESEQKLKKSTELQEEKRRKQNNKLFNSNKITILKQLSKEAHKISDEINMNKDENISGFKKIKNISQCDNINKVINTLDIRSEAELLNNMPTQKKRLEEKIKKNFQDFFDCHTKRKKEIIKHKEEIYTNIQSVIKNHKTRLTKKLNISEEFVMLNELPDVKYFLKEKYVDLQMKKTLFEYDKTLYKGIVKIRFDDIFYEGYIISKGIPLENGEKTYRRG